MSSKPRTFTSKVVAFVYRDQRSEISVSTLTKLSSVQRTIAEIFNIYGPFGFEWRDDFSRYIKINSNSALHDFLIGNHDEYILEVVTENNFDQGSQIPAKVSSANKSSRLPPPGFSKASQSGSPNFRQTSVEKRDSTNPRHTYNQQQISHSGRTSSSHNSSVSEASSSQSGSEPTKRNHQPISQPKSLKEEKKKSPLEVAAEVKRISNIYANDFDGYPSLLLTSQLLIDQVMQGVPIDPKVLRVSLQRQESLLANQEPHPPVDSDQALSEFLWPSDSNRPQTTTYDESDDAYALTLVGAPMDD